MTTLILRKEREKPVLSGHPWIFSGSLKSIPDGLQPGDLVRVVREDGAFAATGYFNSYAQIAVRVLSYDADEVIDVDFFGRKIRAAWEGRTQLIDTAHTNAFRLINAEHDGIPGLIADWYNGVCVVQIHTRGLDAFVQQIREAIVAQLKPTAIYERSDVKQRAREGAEQRATLWYGELPDTIEILENGMKFFVDVAGGQKTGFFLDQRDKRAALGKYCTGKRVLNCFSYTGGFTIGALRGGATRAVSLDASGPALAMARKHVELNGFAAADDMFVEADAVKYLQLLAESGERPFDVIILDPPAFIQHKDKVREGLQGYKKINVAAMKLLPPGGVLLTASCSHHLDQQQFLYMISESAAAAGRRATLLEFYGHSIDHPVRLSFLEGQYLKAAFVRIT